MIVNKSISLVLSGGGARGLAHIGILKVLDQLQIPISSICGCSMGGLIASLYATGLPIYEIEKIATRYSSTREMMKLVDLTPHRKGIIIGQRLRGFLSRFIDDRLNIEDSIIPLYMNAVNLFTSDEVILDRGNLLDAILATTAVPGIFSPFEGDNVTLADGGVVNNLPISIMKAKSSNPIVAVDVHQTFLKKSDIRISNHPHSRSLFPDFVREYYLAELIRTRRLTDLQLKQNPPDLLLVPEIDPNVSTFFGFQRVGELIHAGEMAAQENKDSLLKLLE